MSEPRAKLAVLLASTGLSQSEGARLIGVQDRSMRRWLENERDVPAEAIAVLAVLAAALDRAADQAVAAIDREGGATLLVYRRDEDLLPIAGVPTASAHTALVRRIWERRAAVLELVVFDRRAYDAWRGRRPDTQVVRAEWAAGPGTAAVEFTPTAPPSRP